MSKKSVFICGIIAIVIFIIGLIHLFSMIFVPLPEKTQTKASVITTLNNANEILIKRKLSLKRKYVVFADNVPIATVEGKILPVLGENFSLTSGDGEVISTAKQNIFTLFKTSVDINNYITFEKSKIPFCGGTINSKDNQDTLTWGFFKNDIKEDETISYSIKKNPITNKIRIQKHADSKYNMTEVILMSCTINKSEESSSSNSSSSKNSK